ncbi:MAG: hypothetical protein COW78_03715 [Bdellovibrio sp. CG22_combo_CG10-13_8_21_14_all_39_27]|nr:MAG: hypothetical protein COW78_03715 [Bdellovibrio sp. CG22_combo_CG10-13_8_21_14_all_39_27]
MIIRDFSQTFLQQLKHFPAILVVGARQVGKTTLIKSLLSKTHKYVLLEDPDMRELAINDPKSFLARFTPPLIIDEFQHAPQLVNYLQGIIDNDRDLKGQYVLTGSQNFQMMEQVTQSLSGRIAILSLYGLSSSEYMIDKMFSSKEAIAKIILRGTYPELWKNKEFPPQTWMSSYVQTFLERDLRQLGQVGDLHSFEKFLKVLAIRTGQVLNNSDVAADCGMSPPTIQKWISILERAFVIKLVQPYINNLTSRVRKASKLYFLDTGLAAYLMGFRDEEALLQSPFLGSLFETLVFTDFIKRSSNNGEIPEHYYLQTKSKIGVDFIVSRNQKLSLYEIKLNTTYNNNLAKQLIQTAPTLKNVEQLNLIMSTNEEFDTEISGLKVHVSKWNGLI